MRCGLVDPVLSGFNHGRRFRQSHVFVLCKSMHMRRGEGDEQSGHVAPGGQAE